MSYEYYNNEPNPYGSTLIDVDLGGVEAWGSGNERFLLPAGSYPVIIAKAELKTSGKGSRYINLQYTVTEGAYVKRSIFDSFFLWSSNPRVAKAKFKALRRAVGLNENVGGTLEELVQREFLCVVKTKESTRSNAEPGERENEVSSYKPLPRQVAPAAVQASQRPAAPTASAAPAAAPAASASPAPAPRQQPLVQPSEQQTAQAANGAYPW